jgi:hypothetical protein
MKKAFSLLELIFIIFILILIGSFFTYKITDNSLENATNRLLLYLKQTRYQSLVDDKYENSNSLWHKKRWTLKFFRCDKNVGGIYYSIYSDTNQKGHANLNEALIDPLTNKRIYSTNKCKYSPNTSKYVLLTKEFNINKVIVSCNNTNSLGQLSFARDGKVYTKLSSYDGESNIHELLKACVVRIYNKNNKYKEIIIEPKTGYTYIN